MSNPVVRDNRERGIAIIGSASSKRNLFYASTDATSS